jgi:hypothetical protein
MRLIISFYFVYDKYVGPFTYKPITRFTNDNDLRYLHIPALLDHVDIHCDEFNLSTEFHFSKIIIL